MPCACGIIHTISAVEILSGMWREFLCFFGLAISLVVGQTVAQDAPTTSPSAESAPTPLRIVIIGDSTVCSYPSTRPERGWGQFIEEQFKDGAVKVINLAAAGRSTKSFIKEGRWQKALEEKPNYVLIQFGHNDSRTTRINRRPPTRRPITSNTFAAASTNRAQSGPRPILVTPMMRRTFDPQGKISDDATPPARSLLLYADAMKDVATEKNVAVIDLHTSSKALMDELGPTASAGLANKKGDQTHFNEKGARAMADLVMKELPTAEPKLQRYLKAQ